MSESLRPKEDYFQLDALISGKAANILRTLVALQAESVTEHLRRAIAIHKLIYDAYQDGGRLYAKKLTEAIVLNPCREEPILDESAVRLTVRVNQEAAEFLQSVERTEDREVAQTIDNAVNDYGRFMQHSLEGAEILLREADGTEYEIMILHPL